MQVHGARSFTEIPVEVEEAFERPYRIDATFRVGIEQWAKCLFIKSRQFMLSVQVEEQPVNSQLCERVQFPVAEEPPSDFQRLLGRSEERRVGKECRSRW